MRIVITGAAGRIGAEMADELAPKHDLVLVDRRIVPGTRSFVANLAQYGDRPRLMPWSSGPHPGWWREAFEHADVVLHLAAAQHSLAPWKKVRLHNVVATWNVLDVAARYGIPRVVFASSHWVVKGAEDALAPACYRPGGPKIGSGEPPRPVNAYGVSKAFGETTGRAFVDSGRLATFIAVRIGCYDPEPPSGDVRRIWVGALDTRSLLRRCIETAIEGAHVVYAISGQAGSPFDLGYTRELLDWEPSESA